MNFITTSPLGTYSPPTTLLLHNTTNHKDSNQATRPLSFFSSSSRFVCPSFFLCNASLLRLCLRVVCGLRTPPPRFLLSPTTLPAAAAAAATTYCLLVSLSTTHLYLPSLPLCLPISSRLGHTHPHLVVAVHVDKGRVVTGPHDAIILVLNGGDAVGEKGLLQLVFVLLKVPVEEGRKEGREERRVSE